MPWQRGIEENCVATKEKWHTATSTKYIRKHPFEFVISGQCLIGRNI